MSENLFQPKNVETFEKLSIKLLSKDVVLRFSKYPSEEYLRRKSEVNLLKRKRGKIICFSFDSRRRLRLFARNTSHLWKVFIHLTYPGEFSSDGRWVKRDLGTFLKRLERKYPNIKYFWVIEFQKRGAPHFHILVDQEVDKNWLSQNWYEVVGSGDERHLRAGTRVEAVKSKDHAVRYLATYINKLDQKTVPKEYINIGRFWSHSKNIVEVTEYIVNDSPEGNRKLIRMFRRWYKAQLRLWGYKWKWKEKGFIAWEGRRFFNELDKRGLLNDTYIGLVI